MMRSPTTILIVCSIFALYSCIEEQAPQERTEIRDGAPSLTKSSGSSNYYETLPNPYSLDVMQEVYDIYSDESVVLSATDLYVRFMPQDSSQLRELIYDYNLELFNHPLDIELGQGEDYANTAISEDEPIWLYTTVNPDFNFPDNIPYEIIEECYIPNDDESLYSQTKGGVINVEDAAYTLLGYDEPTEITTRSISTPQGTIEVYDNTSSCYVPLKGVKVRCHRFVKWSVAYTDENGTYTMSKGFRFRPHYGIVFKNTKGFDIWGNYAQFASANHNMGWHSNSGHSDKIPPSSKAWVWAVINNAAYEYYQMCENNDILTPPANLKIWVWRNFCSSSAPMLRAIYDPLLLSSALQVFLGEDFSCSLLPDITIGTMTMTSNGNKVQRSYSSIYGCVNHELAHASHFRQVGEEYWTRYINYIINNWGYGDGTNNDAELCGIGEMWGFAIGEIQVAEKYLSPIEDEYPGIDKNMDGIADPIEGWIYPHVLWDLYRDGVLTKKQIYTCLSPSVDTYSKLYFQMNYLYPEKSTDIALAFDRYSPFQEIVPNWTDFDTYYEDHVVSQPTSISGNNIYIENVSILNDASLNLNLGHSLTINKPFIVERESNLIINFVQ